MRQAASSVAAILTFVYPKTNVTNDDLLLTGKIAAAHLNEFPDYYTRLAKMEKEADEFWAKG